MECKERKSRPLQKSLIRKANNQELKNIAFTFELSYLIAVEDAILKRAKWKPLLEVECFRVPNKNKQYF